MQELSESNDVGGSSPEPSAVVLDDTAPLQCMVVGEVAVKAPEKPIHCNAKSGMKMTDSLTNTEKKLRSEVIFRPILIERRNAANGRIRALREDAAALGKSQSTSMARGMATLVALCHARGGS